MAFGGTFMNKDYYKEMLEKNRLIPYFHDGKLKAIITFYITNDDERFIKADPWDVLDDNEDGFICYIAQYITDKDTHKLSFKIWNNFKKHIKNNFNCEIIRWARFKDGETKTFNFNLRKEEVCYERAI